MIAAVVSLLMQASLSAPLEPHPSIVRPGMPLGADAPLERWNCLFPDGSMPGFYFEVDGRALHRGRERFGLISNTDLGLVAARTVNQLIGPKREVASFVIVFDRADGQISFAAVVGNEQTNAPARGRCTRVPD